MSVLSSCRSGWLPSESTDANAIAKMQPRLPDRRGEWSARVKVAREVTGTEKQSGDEQGQQDAAAGWKQVGSSM